MEHTICDHLHSQVSQCPTCDAGQQVMPLQDLVQQDPVEESAEAEPEQASRQGKAPGKSVSTPCTRIFHGRLLPTLFLPGAKWQEACAGRLSEPLHLRPSCLGKA